MDRDIPERETWVSLVKIVRPGVSSDSRRPIASVVSSLVYRRVVIVRFLPRGGLPVALGR